TADRQAIGDVGGTLDRTARFLGLRGVQTDETQRNGARGIATVERTSIECSGGDRPNDVAAGRNRNAAGDDTARANLPAKRKPAGHDNADHRRSQSRSRGEENERGRKAEGRYQRQVARALASQEQQGGGGEHSSAALFSSLVNTAPAQCLRQIRLRGSGRRQY